jgi:hypothetical protein
LNLIRLQNDFALYQPKRRSRPCGGYRSPEVCSRGGGRFVGRRLGLDRVIEEIRWPVHIWNSRDIVV